MTKNREIELAYLEIDRKSDELWDYKRFYRKDGAAIPYPMRSDSPTDMLDDIDLSVRSPLLESEGPMMALNHPHSITDAIRRFERDVIYIDEGLEKSWDVGQFMRAYGKILENRRGDIADMSIGGFFKGHTESFKDFRYYNPNNPSMVAVAFPTDVTDFTDTDGRRLDKYLSDEIKNVADALFVTGWNFSYASRVGTVAIRNDDGRDIAVTLFMLTFEKKFHDIDVKLPEVLYHVAPQRYFDKIVRQGITPRANSSEYEYPERVYLFGADAIGTAERYGLRKTSVMKSSKGSPFVNDNGFVIFKILRKTIENSRLYKDSKLVFYYDPMFKDCERYGLESSPGFFTYGSIPSDMLERDALYYSVDGDTVGSLNPRRQHLDYIRI